MGCDIHSVIQVRRNCDPLTIGAWQTIGEGLEDRNYDVFGILADVRSSVFKPISRPRGFPEDFVYEVDKDYPEIRRHLMNDKMFYMGQHSFSYLTAKQLLKYKWDKIASCDSDFPPDLQRLLYSLKELADEYGDENVRMVFGFDS